MAELDDVLEVSWADGAGGGEEGVLSGRVEIGSGWAIGDAVNGGVLMALGARGLSQVFAPSGHGDVLTWSAFFLTAAQPGEVEVEVEVLRLPASRDSSPQAQVIALLDRLDVRVDPATAGFAVGRPTGRGVIRAWLRMADGREPDVAMLPLAVDALMPVSFDLGVPGWAPTLELTGQVLGRPAPGWLRVELMTDTVVGGFYVEDALVWDSNGRLVARSRQFAGVRMPAN